jgi:hypothetical protein
VRAVGCEPRAETECAVGEDSVTITGLPATPLFGNIRAAYLEFEAIGLVNGYSSLHAVVTASSARVPDIGLQVTAVDGSVRISDPPPTVTGDLDCDHHVVAKDAIEALLARTSSTPAFCVSQGDVDCNGVVDAFDGLAIVAHLAEIARPLVTDCPLIGSAFEPSLPGTAALAPEQAAEDPAH